MGKAVSKDGKRCYVVARYEPPGNVCGRSAWK